MKKEKNKENFSKQIDNIIKKYPGWKGDIVSKLREVINKSDSKIIEEVKWKMPSNPEGLPVWSYNGIICIVQIFKNDVKLVFFKGAQMKDPKKLFNARFNSKTDRAIEFHEGDKINESAIKSLVKEAVKLNK
jgi:hypothetical protein